MATKKPASTRKTKTPTKKTASGKSMKKKTPKAASKRASSKSSPRKVTASAKTRTAKTTKKKPDASPKKKSTKTKAGESEVTIDRRRKATRRAKEAAASKAAATEAKKLAKKAEVLETEEEETEAPKPERREKVQRRRQIDPTTCERDYTDVEVEFMSAMDEYKRKNGRMFPTCSEVLEVVISLGYMKLTSAEIVARKALEPACDSETTLGDNAAEVTCDANVESGNTLLASTATESNGFCSQESAVL